MKALRRAAIGAAIVMMSGSAMADGPSWNYIDLGYNFMSGFDEGNGYTLSSAYAVGGMFHVKGEYSSYSDLDNFFSGDMDGYELSVGVHPSVSETMDLVIDLGYFDYSADEGFAEDASGIILRTGARAMVTEKFELMGMLEASNGDTNFDESFNDVVVRLGGRYLFNDSVSVGAHWSEGSNIHGDLIRFDARWSFGAGQ